MIGPEPMPFEWHHQLHDFELRESLGRRYVLNEARNRDHLVCVACRQRVSRPKETNAHHIYELAAETAEAKK